MAEVKWHNARYNFCFLLWLRDGKYLLKACRFDRFLRTSITESIVEQQVELPNMKTNLLLLSLFLLTIGALQAQPATSASDMGRQVGKTTPTSFKSVLQFKHYHPLEVYQKPLESVAIEVYNLTKQQEVMATTSLTPSFEFTFQAGNTYVFRFIKDGYFVKRIVARIGTDGCIACFEGLNTLMDQDANADLRDLSQIDVFMLPEQRGPRLTLNKMTFGSDKTADLNAASVMALNEVALFLADNPHLVVQLEVHTDARGDQEANRMLGQQRGEAILQYLKTRGVSERSVFVKNYGATRPVVNCAENVPCSEVEHSRNRRVVCWFRSVMASNPCAQRSLVELLTAEGWIKPAAALRTDVAKSSDTPNANVTTDVEPLPRVPTTQMFSASAFYDGNQPNMNAVGKDKICDVNNIDPMAGTDPDAGLQVTRAAMGRVPGSQFISKRATVAYDESGERVIRRTGQATVVSETFTGYKVELMLSKDELGNDAPIFKRYGKVFLDDTGTHFSYMIGAFDELEPAKAFMEAVIKPYYKEARVIKYQEGARIKAN